MGVLLLLIAVAVVFGRVVTFDFVRWDDDINITRNPLLQAPWSWDLVAKLFESDQAMRFKPLHWLLDVGVQRGFGFAPWAWHALNLGLHLLATALFLVSLRRVFQLAGGPLAGTWGGRVAWLAAAAWALHPLRAEPVAWATASTYPFTAVWLLASFACYVEAVGFGRGPRWLVASWLGAVASYASYPVGLSYALFLVATDEWLRSLPRAVAPATAVGPWPRRLGRYAAFFLPAVAAAGFTIWTRYTAPGIFTNAPAIEEVDLGSRLAMALASLAHLAGRFFWPGRMSPNIPPAELTAAMLPWLIGLAALALGVLAWAWRRRSRHPGTFWVASGFAALSLPCLGLTERPTWPVDRYSYVVHLPLAAGVLAWLGRRWAAGRWRAAELVAPLLIVAAAAMAFHQTRIWRDSRALFGFMESEPQFSEVPRQQAHVYFLWGVHEREHAGEPRAQELFDRAHGVFVEAMRQAVAKGDYREALSLSMDYTRYFRITPEILRERGAWLLRLGNKEAARTELEAARRLAPGDVRVAELLREAENGGGR